MPVRTRIAIRSLIRRLEKLEAQLLPVQPPPAPPNEEDLLFQQALELLLDRMEPEHRSLVVEDLRRVRIPDYRMGNLTFMVLHYVELHLKAQTPLQLPKAVASVYLQDPDARPEHDCADCGYDLPFTQPHPLTQPPREARVYFDRCPVCGGKVGWHAFYIQHGYFKSHRPGLAA